MKKLLYIPALAGLIAALLPGAANAALTCPVRSSIFGTVFNVHQAQNRFTLGSLPGEFGRMGYIHVIGSGAQLNTNGLSLQRGSGGTGGGGKTPGVGAGALPGTGGAGYTQPGPFEDSGGG